MLKFNLHYLVFQRQMTNLLEKESHATPKVSQFNPKTDTDAPAFSKMYFGT